MSAIPTQYPVTMTDGTTDYEVFDASAYVNAVFSLGHQEKAEAAKVAGRRK